MIQMTTPKHKFNIPFDAGRIEKVRVLYAQNGQVILTKTEEDCVFEKKEISLTLTQAETAMFEADTNVDIQLHVKTTDCASLVSHKTTVCCEECMDDEVL